MGHFCDNCGSACYCDWEDLMFDQPNNCRHLTTPNECAESDETIEDDCAPPRPQEGKGER